VRWFLPSVPRCLAPGPATPAVSSEPPKPMGSPVATMRAKGRIKTIHGAKTRVGGQGIAGSTRYQVPRRVVAVTVRVRVARCYYNW
jgi:hypothetical protein